MKYIITESQLKKSIFKYLDMEFGGLKSKKGENYDVVFKSANGDYNEFGWDVSGTLTIQRDVTEKLTDFFMLDNSNSVDIIRSWFKDRYKLPVDKVKFTRLMLIDKKFLIE